MSRRDRVVGFRLEEDVGKFVESHGKARKTDPDQGRYNFSEIVNDYLKQFIAGQEPHLIARVYKRERDELQRATEELDSKVRTDLGIPLSSLDDFITTHSKKAASQAQEAKSRARSRADRLLEHIRGEFGKHRPRNPQAWLTGRFQAELKVLGLTAEEALAEITAPRTPDDGGRR